MAKPIRKEEIAVEPAPGEFGPITWAEFQALPEDVQKRRMNRANEKLAALAGRVHLNIDIDELRGRNRR
jgi:hypothetical protein